MIVLKDITWTTPGVKADRLEKGLLGESLCLLINSVVVHILPIDQDVSTFIITADSFIDYGPYEDLFLVGIVNDGIEKQLLCDEKTYSILLSNPRFAPILDIHKYKHMVGIGWHYINNEFVIPGELE